MTGRVMVGVGAVIEDEAGRILLVKHTPQRGGFWQGKWICPGGELEPGETIEEGIKREVREEAGLEVELLGRLPPFERIVRSGDVVTLHVLYIDCLARVVGGELGAGSDVGEAIWIEKGRIPEIWEELHEDTRKLLRLAGVVS